MICKIIQLIIPTLMLLSLTSAFTHVEGQSGLVGVRLSSEMRDQWQLSSQQTAIMIEYDSFTWMVMSPRDLIDLDNADLVYQEIPNPYTLTLGGQTFDPLLSPPRFSPELHRNTDPAQPGLHLVQFYGPTKTEWLEALEAAGLEVVQYIHPFTYVVWGEPAVIASQMGQDFIRWGGDYLPAFAFQNMQSSLDRDSIKVRLLVYPEAGLAETRQALQALGGTDIRIQSGLDPVFELITCKLPGDQISPAAALPGVYTLQAVPTDGGNRGEMSNQVNAGNLDGSNLAFPGYQAWLNELNLSGQGVIIAHVDTGFDQVHPDLFNRTLPCNGSTCGIDAASPHGTHTAGIIAGDGSSGVTDSFGFLRGLGMAPGANLVEQLHSPTYTEEGGMLTLMTESHRNLAVISGNSWGPSATPLGYDADTRWVDIGVRDADPQTEGNQPLSYVLSIMNGYGGTSTQGTPDDAKNVLSVGSTYLQFGDGSQNLNINNLSVNTAHGPALDGRTIPHLVAPGCYVDSPYFPDSGFFLRCGTSMASPHVSGAAALFFEKYRGQFDKDPSPAMVKAAFLPVAHNLAGNRDADGEILGHPFDAKQGWGRLNLNPVLAPPDALFYFDQEVIFNESGQSWSVDIPLNLPMGYLKAMLVWTDAPGHGLGGSTPAWVNNLDLSLVMNNQTYYANNFGPDGFSIPGGIPDERNNTEGIFLESLPVGTYTLTVTAANISGDGVPGNGSLTDQDFALVVYYGPANQEGLSYEYYFPLFFR